MGSFGAPETRRHRTKDPKLPAAPHLGVGPSHKKRDQAKLVKTVSPTAKPYARTCLPPKWAREKSRRRKYFLQRGQHAHVAGACVADGYLQCSQQRRQKKEGKRKSAFSIKLATACVRRCSWLHSLPTATSITQVCNHGCLHLKERRIFTLSSQRRCCGGGCDARALSAVAALLKQCVALSRHAQQGCVCRCFACHARRHASGGVLDVSCSVLELSW